MPMHTSQLMATRQQLLCQLHYTRRHNRILAIKMSCEYVAVEDVNNISWSKWLTSVNSLLNSFPSSLKGIQRFDFLWMAKHNVMISNGGGGNNINFSWFISFFFFPLFIILGVQNQTNWIVRKMQDLNVIVNFNANLEFWYLLVKRYVTDLQLKFMFQTGGVHSPNVLYIRGNTIHGGSKRLQINSELLWIKFFHFWSFLLGNFPDSTEPYFSGMDTSDLIFGLCKQVRAIENRGLTACWGDSQPNQNRIPAIFY